MTKVLEPKTKSNCTEDFQVVRGGSNVFADLGFDADEVAELTLKSVLMEELQMIIENMLAQPHVTQKMLADRMGAEQPRISAIRNGKISGFSVERLSEYLLALGYNIKIEFEKATADTKRGSVTAHSRMV